MLLAGDEISHTQQGNNNGYCQDNKLTWLNWEITPAKQAMLEFTRRLIQIRRSQPALQRRRFFHGAPIFGTNVKDIRTGSTAGGFVVRGCAGGDWSLRPAVANAERALR